MSASSVLAQPDPALHVRVDTDVGPLWLPGADTLMRPYVMRRHTWDETGGALLRTLVRPGFTVLDAGAGIGYHSILASQVAVHVRIDAVEANPRALPLLRWNLPANGVQRATVHDVVLGDAPGSLSLLPSDDDVLAVARVDAAVPGAAPAAVVRADDHFAARSFDVVRLDLRGWEPEALAGMGALLRRSPGVVAVVAFWPFMLRARGADPHAVLRGYRDLGLERRVIVSHDPHVMSDDDVVLICDNAGRSGRVNLLLR